MIANDTIAALSSAPGLGAIAIVRVSGPDAIGITARIFNAKQKNLESDSQGKWNAVSHKAYVGQIIEPASGEAIDEVVAIVYRAPHTYTGEDLVEINCHGSPVVTRKITDLLLNTGCRLAQKGEFTKRAFLNGRIDLTQAEAVLDLLTSKTERQSRLALTALKGALGDEIKLVRKSLMQLMTRITAGIDFPEEVGELPFDDIAGILETSIEKLAELDRTSRSGRYLRTGLKLAIVGRPNAGKSSLMNKLLKFERAIVTDIPGTTRDSIEEPVDINGLPVILIDTAGVRDTKDTVEQIGIDRTIKAIAEADLTLLLIDGQTGPGDDEKEIVAELAKRQTPVLIALSKSDLAPEARWTRADIQKQFGTSLHFALAESADEPLKISSTTGDGLNRLRSAIEIFATQGSHLQELGGSLNERQSQLCKRALASLADAQKTVRAGLPQDCLSTDLRGSLDALDEIAGDVVTEEIITEVFNNFCIGK